MSWRPEETELKYTIAAVGILFTTIVLIAGIWVEAETIFNYLIGFFCFAVPMTILIFWSTQSEKQRESKKDWDW